MTWLVAPLVVALVIDRHRWCKPATLGLVIAVLTFAVYPLTYWGLLLAEPFPARAADRPQRAARGALRVGRRPARARAASIRTCTPAVTGVARVR